MKIMIPNEGIRLIPESENIIKLKLLSKLLEDAGVRKYTCINGFGYSQLERDIVDTLSNDKKNQVQYTEQEVYDILRRYNSEQEGQPWFDTDEEWFKKNKKK